MPDEGARPNAGTRRYQIKVIFERELDANRLEEWCHANYDDETVLILDHESKTAHKYEEGEFVDD